MISVGFEYSPLEQQVTEQIEMQQLQDSYQGLQPLPEYSRRDPFRTDLGIDTAEGQYRIDDLDNCTIKSFEEIDNFDED